MAALLQIRWPPTISARYLKTLAPRAGFDLATNRLKAASNERATTNISVHLSARSAEFTSLADFIRYSLPTFGNTETGRFCCQAVARGRRRWVGGISPIEG
jgi:hypothetical protein